MIQFPTPIHLHANLYTGSIDREKAMLLSLFVESRKCKNTIHPSLALYECEQSQPAEKRVFKLGEVVHGNGDVANVWEESRMHTG